MTGALKYELMRIRTIRSSYWMSGMAILFSAAITTILAIFVHSSDIEDTDIAQVTTWILTAGASLPVTPVLAAPFYAVMGCMAMGHEYRYGTNKATLTAIPDRAAVLTAKALVLVGWVLVTVVATLLLNLAITGLFMDNPTWSSSAWRPIVNYAGYCAGFALAGFGLASVFRNQVGAIVTALLWPLVAEPIIYGVAVGISQASDSSIGNLTNLLPASAGRRSMFDPYELSVGFGTDINVWGIGTSTFVFWLGVILVIAAGCTTFIKRDA
jgi:ABC-type transport system involved in multi-copper enzyme maturation permease subunit